MQIKRTIEKIPGGMMLVPLFLGALCHTFSPGAGKYFGSFTNGMITGTVPILAVWFFCMGASIKLSATGTVGAAHPKRSAYADIMIHRKTDHDICKTISILMPHML